MQPDGMTTWAQPKSLQPRRGMLWPRRPGSTKLPQAETGSRRGDAYADLASWITVAVAALGLVPDTSACAAVDVSGSMRRRQQVNAGHEVVMDPGVSYLPGSIGRDELPEGAPDDRPAFLGGVRLPRPARPGPVLFRTPRAAGDEGRRWLGRHRGRPDPPELPARTRSPAAALAQPGLPAASPSGHPRQRHRRRRGERARARGNTTAQHRTRLPGLRRPSRSPLLPRMGIAAPP